MAAEYVTAKTAYGYDVVDPSTGLVVGELERICGAYVKDVWTVSVVENDFSGRGFDGPSLYRGIYQSRHGETSVKKMAFDTWRQSAWWRKSLSKHRAQPGASKENN